MKPFYKLILLLILFVGLYNDVAQAQCSPTLREIYNFEVGDQFYYRITHRQDDVKSYYTYEYENYEIIDKKAVGDTLQYIRLSDNNIMDTLQFIDSSFHPLNRCFPVIDSTLPHCGNYWSSDKDFMRIYRIRDSNENNYKLFGTKTVREIFNPDGAGYFHFELDDFIGYSLECYSIFREGLGVINQGTFTFETGLFYELSKHIRGEDTLQFSLSTPYQEIASPTVSIYPNPVQNSCYVHCPYNIQEVYVTDISGRFQDTSVEINSQSIWTLNTSNLIPGVYYLTIKTEKGNVVKKLLKY